MLKRRHLFWTGVGGEGVREGMCRAIAAHCVNPFIMPPPLPLSLFFHLINVLLLRVQSKSLFPICVVNIIYLCWSVAEVVKIINLCKCGLSSPLPPLSARDNQHSRIISKSARCDQNCLSYMMQHPMSWIT